jgi:hypothetical protein
MALCYNRPMKTIEAKEFREILSIITGGRTPQISTPEIIKNVDSIIEGQMEAFWNNPATREVILVQNILNYVAQVWCYSPDPEIQTLAKHVRAFLDQSQDMSYQIGVPRHGKLWFEKVKQ